MINGNGKWWMPAIGTVLGIAGGLWFFVKPLTDQAQAERDAAERERVRLAEQIAENRRSIAAKGEAIAAFQAGFTVEIRAFQGQLELTRSDIALLRGEIRAVVQELKK